MSLHVFEIQAAPVTEMGGMQRKVVEPNAFLLCFPGVGRMEKDTPQVNRILWLAPGLFCILLFSFASQEHVRVYLHLGCVFKCRRADDPWSAKCRSICLVGMSLSYSRKEECLSV